MTERRKQSFLEKIYKKRWNAIIVFGKEGDGTWVNKLSSAKRNCKGTSMNSMTLMICETSKEFTLYATFANNLRTIKFTKVRQIFNILHA